MIEIQNDFTNPISVLTEKQREFLSLNRSALTGEEVDYLRLQKGENDYSFPKTLTLRWTPTIQAKVLLSEYDDLREPIEFFGKGACEIDNLKIYL